MSEAYDVLSGRRMPSRKFKDAQALRNFLLENDSPGNFLYRGQIRRYSHQFWMVAQNKPVALEALYPTDFRFFNEERVHRVSNEWITFERQAHRDKRDRFFSWMETYVRTHPASEFGWLSKIIGEDNERTVRLFAELRHELPGFSPDYDRGTPEIRDLVARRMDHYGLGLHSLKTAVLWSLAQHYELSTALVDLTDAIDVALWFATNEWRDGSPPPTSGYGCIYKFNYAQLETILANHHKLQNARLAALGLSERVPRFFVQRIGDMIEGGALRPKRQRGASVYGFDQPLVLATVAQYGVVEVFEFEHSAHGSGLDLGPVNRGYLKPVDDPMRSLVDQFLLEDNINESMPPPDETLILQK
jgi:hypothetical protein